ncbi:MAG: hypothetical protein M3Q54_12860 [Actinomycetota bacterium]|nr:hypothetical protein [Rubrobacter sp.]MDQ3238408.1 hypothetical protein [Actinomycetota bacterium]
MTAERYTIVFTGLLTDRKAGEYPYLTAGDTSEGSGSGTLHRGRPPRERMKREICLHDLPEYAREAVVKEYVKLWDL